MAKKYNSRLLFLSMILLILIQLSAAAQVFEDYAVFYIDTENPFTLIRAEVVQNDFYHEHLLYADMLGPTAYTISFEDADEGLLFYGDLMDLKTVINQFDLRYAAKLKIVKDGFVYFEQPISFCNNNGVCEPCNTANCTVIENSLTCIDCPTGSAEGYCDLVKDDICDPDCNNEDADCPGCEPFCFYDQMERPSFCSDFGGTVCADGEICKGDRLVVETIDADYGKNCCIGDASCVPIKQADDVPTQVFSANYGADVLSEDEMFELEAKERAEFGMGFDGESLTTEEQEEMYEDGYGMEVLDPVVMSDKDWDDLIEADESFPTEYEEPPTFTETVKEQVSEVIASVPEEASPLLVIFVAVIIMITLGLLVLFFTHKAHKQLSKEESTQKTGEEIDRLLKRGYSYEQIKTTLINKGYDLITVNGEIVKHSSRTRLK